MAKKKKTEERTLEVSAERMQEIMAPVAEVLDRMHTNTLEDIFLGREIMANGMRQLCQHNPKADPVALLRDVMADVERALLADAGANVATIKGLPVGEA